MNKIIFSLKKHNNEHYSDAFIFGGIIGAIIFIAIYGVNVLRFTNINWLLHSDELEGLWDLTQHYIGWVFYRDTPWRFPLGLTEGLTAEPISVAYTDSIPLFALIFKILSPVLPSTFQYFGLFELITYILMGGFGALITRYYTNNILYNLGSAALFTLSPALLKRVFYHSALSGHFVILIAFCLWIYKNNYSSIKKHIAHWTLLIVIATLINPYYSPMVAGIMMLSILSDLISSRFSLVSVKKAIVATVIPAFFTAIAGYVIGLFYGSVSSTATGLDKLSANINSLFNSMDYELRIPSALNFQFNKKNYSAFLSGLPYGIDWQEEGFAYLGLGMILLLAIVLILFVYKVTSKKISLLTSPSTVIPIAVGFIVFSLLAFGPIAYVNSHKLYELNLPAFIFNLLSTFRSEGRFIWPVHFGVMSLLLIGLIKLLPNNKNAIVILSLIIVLQIGDLSPALIAKHNTYAKIPYNNSEEFDNFILTDPIWNKLGSKKEKIVIYPPSETTICISPGISCSLSIYAKKNGMKLNATYCSRPIHEAADRYAYECIKNRRSNKNDDRIIYVFMNPDSLSEVEDLGLTFYEADGLTIGY